MPRLAPWLLAASCFTPAVAEDPAATPRAAVARVDGRIHLDLLGVQSRLRWTLRPGNDVHLVFNRGWERRADGALLPSFDRGSARLQYTIRL